MKYVGPNEGSYKFIVEEEVRERLAAGESVEEVMPTWGGLGCYQNVWDWANRPVDMDLRETLHRDRAEQCFFFPHTPGMFFPAASELEKREADRREASRDRRHSLRREVAAALIGVAATALVGAVGAMLAGWFKVR